MDTKLSNSGPIFQRILRTNTGKEKPCCATPSSHEENDSGNIFWPTAKVWALSPFSWSSATTMEFGFAWCGIGWAKLREITHVMRQALQEAMLMESTSSYPFVGRQREKQGHALQHMCNVCNMQDKYGYDFQFNCIDCMIVVRDIEIIQGSAGHGELNALRAGIIFRHAARATQSTDRHFQLLSCRWSGL